MSLVSRSIGVLFYYTFLLQIQRKQVDSFVPGKTIPCYQLSARAKEPLSRLFHRLSLLGAKEPSNMITVDIDPSVYGNLIHCT